MKLYRKRLIPEECKELKDDVILYQDEDKVITSWNVLKPRNDFSHGLSCYYMKEGIKVSKLLREDGSLKYWYCDIIKTEKIEEGYVFVDLLADVIVESDGMVRVVDLDEMAEACEKDLITKEEMNLALRQLDALLQKIYKGEFAAYQKALDSWEK